MRPRIVLAGVTIAVALASYLGVKLLRSQGVLKSNKSPFTAEIQKITTGPQSGQVVDEVDVFARRSDGSEVRVRSRLFPDGTPAVTRKIVLVREKKIIVVDEATKSLVTEFRGESAWVEFMNRPSDSSCRSHPEFSGEAVVIGQGELMDVSVVKLQMDTPDVHRERWEAPDLDCFPLFNRVEYMWPDGSLRARKEETVADLTYGEPSPDLFAVPVDYQERSPSALMAEHLRLLNAGPVDVSPFAQRDEVYYQSRQYAPEGQ